MASNSGARIIGRNLSTFDTYKRRNDGRQRDFRGNRFKLRPGCAEVVEQLATEYAGKVKIGKMDVDSNSATPMRYNVRGIPTLLVFKGGQVKEQIVGYVAKEQIQKALDKHIG
jgi:thiol-disulfide isomerase/thioredoxin